MAGPVHSTNPPRLIHLIWGGHTVGYSSRLRICVEKKIELPPRLLCLLFSFVTYRPGFIYFLCNEMPRTDAAVRPSHCTTLTKIRNYSAPEKGIFSLLYICIYKKWWRRVFESFDNFHLSEIRETIVLYFLSRVCKKKVKGKNHEYIKLDHQSV